MKYFFTLIFCFLAFNSLAIHVQADGHHRHGEMKTDDSQNTVIWNQDLQQWTDVESFWMHFAESRGGLTWEKSSTYPEYSQVKEYDTFLVELDQGTCLMEFFHQRWRRANDVRRWNDKLNEYSACPYVFD